MIVKGEGKTISLKNEHDNIILNIYKYIYLAAITDFLSARCHSEAESVLLNVNSI